VFAFEIHHDWSHAAAIQSTLERTESTTGFRTGAGLYVNYLFTLVWVSDAVYWWLAGVKRYRDRPAWMMLTLHGILSIYDLQRRNCLCDRSGAMAGNRRRRNGRAIVMANLCQNKVIKCETLMKERRTGVFHS
jgi:hypothetical protein